MSRIFALVCHETRQMVRVGQNEPNMHTFWSGDDRTMDALGDFLSATIGKPLVLLCTDKHVDEICEYEEFE